MIAAIDGGSATKKVPAAFGWVFVKRFLRNDTATACQG